MPNDERLAPAAVGSKEGYALQLSTAGVVMPAQLGDMIEFARIMCKADLAIPKHLRGNPGACLAVAMRARAWAMDPFAVSTKTYAVNDILAYESQLINAVINRHAPIKGRLVPRYTGEGPDRQCILEPETAEGQVLPYVSPKVKDIPTKNSPLWKADPDQQLFYSSSRAWARRYFPDLILGVYDPDEARSMKDITPEKPVENYLNDDEGHDPQTGEVIAPKAASKPGEKINTTVFDEATNPTEEQEKLWYGRPTTADEAPRDMTEAEKLLAVIAGHVDAVHLQEWQHTCQAMINALPKEDFKTVRKALADKLFELEAT